MKTYTRLKSILSKDGKKYLVGLIEWGPLSLQGEELQQFDTYLIELGKHYDDNISAGNLTYSPIIEEITLSSGKKLDVVIGWNFSVTDSYIFPVKEAEWYEKMSKDPLVVKYNELVSGD